MNSNSNKKKQENNKQLGVDDDTKRLLDFLLCEIFHANALSLPPEPISNMFMFYRF